MTDKEKEILEATKYFAESNDLPYDTYIESMILNAIREATKPFNQQNDEMLERLKQFRARIYQQSFSNMQLREMADSLIEIQKSEKK